MPKEAPLPDFTPGGIQFPLADDKIKDGTSPSALADNFKALATTADTHAHNTAQGAIDDATTKYGGLPARVTGLENRKALPMVDAVAGDNFDNMRTRMQVVVRDNTTAAQVSGMPVAAPGVLDIDATPSGIMFQTYRAYGTTGGLFYRQTLNIGSSPFPWRPWVRIDAPKALAYTDLLGGTDANTLRTPGKHRVISSTIAGQIANLPGTVKRAGVLSVDAFDSGITFQTYVEYAGTIWFRSTSSVGTSPFPYSAWVDLAAQPSLANNPHSGLANSLRVDDFTERRGGVKKTGGLGACAFRFDHGLNNFKTEILPLLQQYGIKGSLALNSRTWTDAENNLVTQAEVDGWVTSGWVEIWNHTATHGDASTYSALTDTIVGGLTELRAQLPSAVIDGFVIPGVGGGTNLGGLDSGISPEKFYNTDAGRLILEHHAVTSGAYPLTDRRILDGKVRQGMGHWTMDSQTSANLISRLQGTQTAKKGLQFMLHPSLVNTTGYMTTADVDAVLAFAAAERDAGRLKIYSPYDLLLADAT